MSGRRRLNIGFDLDGVLIRNPFDTCVLPRLQRLLSSSPGVRAMPVEALSKEVRARVGAGWRARMATGDLAGSYDWDAIYREVASDLGADDERLAAIDVAQWVCDCCGEGGHIAALPGAEDVLAELAAVGHRLVVISNGYSAYQKPVLSALGLLDYFEEVVTPEIVGHAKPDRRIFDAAAPLDVFVGDTLVHDVLGARQAGIKAVWMAPRLPEDLALLAPLERGRAAALTPVIRASLSGSPHSHYHPEADEEACRPTAVVRDLFETAELLLKSSLSDDFSLDAKA